MPHSRRTSKYLFPSGGFAVLANKGNGYGVFNARNKGSLFVGFTFQKSLWLLLFRGEAANRLFCQSMPACLKDWLVLRNSWVLENVTLFNQAAAPLLSVDSLRCGG
jgi:hypothetical protein